MTKKKLIQEFLLMTFGTALVAIGTYVFKFPNNFSTGGVTGMAVILSSVFPAISSSTYAAVINLLFWCWALLCSTGALDCARCTAQCCSPGCCP